MTAVFQMVDVFGDGPVSGNPVAVIAQANDLEPEQMMRITHWFNLSETTFLLPPTRPEADYRVRIFTLSGEIPFAGHPTLGTCHAWLAAGGKPKDGSEIIQECAAGLIAIRREQGRLAFAAPPLLRSGAPSAQELAEAREVLGIEAHDVIDAAWLDNGPGWLGIKFASADKVLSLNPLRSWPRQVDIGVVGPHPAGSDVAFELRAFFSDSLGTIIEDPVTGSLNAAVGDWLFNTGDARNAYIAAQGGRLGRSGRIYVRRDAQGQTWVAGQTRTHVQGQFLGVEAWSQVSSP
ncbi:PhzF family phenazine biosynthesis protein [Pseudomonas sp. MYb185]|uniref:PhzF family phenazine biosynthesis protein n=1 Tax=Pseudomonas sp. MYb185 TaxID=1848729 RepID=UPI0015B34E1C